jgi:methyl-accepting chemotaxis protein
MLKKIGIRGKFISIVSLVAIVLLATMALVIISTVSKSQSQQANSFIDLLKTEQANQGKLLNKGLLQKGQSIARLLAQTGSGLIVGFDFDTLEQVAKNGANDPEISFVTFYDKAGKAVTKQSNLQKDPKVKVIKEKITFEKDLVGFVELGLNSDFIEKNMSEISAHITKMAKNTREANEKAMRAVINLIVVSASIGVVLLWLIIYWTVSRIMIRPINLITQELNESANQVASVSGQVSSSGQSLSEGASEQASSLEETSSSLEEMSSMTKLNADNATQADVLMKEANQIIGKANNSMNEVTTSMEEIRKASEETQKIIKTIDEIAFQTNLLALNAAVEAARAGETGAGFAVVADEVRNLAMRAADAAKNTSSLIENTVEKVKDGAENVTRTNEAFTEVATSAAKVGELVSEITAASQEQSQGLEQVNKAIAEMDKVTQQNAANAEESASASEEMHAQAEQMRGVVGMLGTLVGGNRKDGDVQSNEENGGKAKGVDKTAANSSMKSVSARVSKVRGGNEVSPNEVIPMENDDFKDF